MSIERAIFEVLEDDSISDAVALLALLPFERITTGENHDRDLPYCNVNFESNQSEYRSNKGGERKPVIRFQLWHENHAEGVAIRDAIETLFERKTFETTQTRLETWHVNSLSLQEDDGAWQFLIDIEALLKIKSN